MLSPTSFKGPWLNSLFVGALFLLGAAYLQAEDSSLENEILGQWRYQKEQLTAKIDCVSTFAEDQNYAAEMTIKLLGTTSTVKIKGTWSIHNRTSVKIKVTETDNKLLFPKGKVLEKDNVKIKGNVMTYRHDGKEEKESRIKPDPASETKADS